MVKAAVRQMQVVNLAENRHSIFLFQATGVRANVLQLVLELPYHAVLSMDLLR